MIFVGASFCGEATNPALPRGVQAFRDSLAAEANASGKHLSSIGVSIDNDVEIGTAFLSRFAGFDEVSVGGNWLNGAALLYIVRDVPGRLMIPQIVVVERDISTSGNVLNVGRDSLVKRVFSREILALGDRAERRRTSH